MKNVIPRYHLAMSREDFRAKQRSGHFNGFYNSLSYNEIPAHTENFLPLLHKVGSPWSWDNISKYKDTDYLDKHLAEAGTRLFHLLDGFKVVGYSLIINPSEKSLQPFRQVFSPDSKIIEIENLGLFPDQAGKGRGAKFFEMIMADLFKEFDYVYWSMSSTNHPHLLKFYTQKLGMKHIATNYAPDFRKDEIAQDNGRKEAA